MNWWRGTRRLFVVLILAWLVACVRTADDAPAVGFRLGLKELTGFLQGLTFSAESREYSLEDYKRAGGLSALLHEGAAHPMSQEVHWDSGAQWLALSYSPSTFASADTTDSPGVPQVLIILDPATWSFMPFPGSVLGLRVGETMKGVSWASDGKLDLLTVSRMLARQGRTRRSFNVFTLHSLELNEPSLQEAVNVTDLLREIGVSLRVPVLTTSALVSREGKTYIGFMDGTLLVLGREKGEVTLLDLGVRREEEPTAWMVDFAVDQGALMYAVYFEKHLSVYQARLREDLRADHVRRLMRIEPIGGAEVIGIGKIVSAPWGFLLFTLHRVYAHSDSGQSLLWNGETSEREVLAAFTRKEHVILLTVGEWGSGVIDTVELTADVT